jgi:hypothetical protein
MLKKKKRGKGCGHPSTKVTINETMSLVCEETPCPKVTSPLTSSWEIILDLGNDLPNRAP